MAGQIVVALKRNDRVEDFIPCLTEMARPGTKVTFLMHFPVDGIERFIAHYSNMETGIDGVVAAQRMAESYAMADQKRRAQMKTLPACESLRTAGVLVDVEVYAGKMRAIVEKYASNSNVRLILLRVNDRGSLFRVLSRASRLFRLARAVATPRVLLLHPQH